MNFFEHQEQARASTTKLVLLFMLAVSVLIGVTSYFVALLLSIQHSQGLLPLNPTAVMSPRILFGTAGVIVSVVFGGAFYRMAQLSSGGRVIAESMGGRLLNRDQADIDELKILNVVEEMALASGTPVPPVYLIKDDAINAFAAGFHPRDAIIGVTRGAVRFLNRDELQGVIAHEFSHILNGDMRLNLRLVGWLHGLLLLALLGRMLMRGRILPRRSDKSVAVTLVVGLVLYILGYTGVFFGNLIKSAVSRQREFLADASAVQFTRSRDGIGNALKKIGGYPLGSRMLMHETTEISHMLIAEGGWKRSWIGWLATHPSLTKRISRIYPHWDGELINPRKPQDISYSTIDDAKASGVVCSKSMEALAAAVTAAAATVSSQSLRLVQKEIAEIPEVVRQQLTTSLEASLLMYGLLIAQSPAVLARKQLLLLQQQCEPSSFTLLAAQLKAIVPLPRSLDMMLVELAQPALKQLSSEQLKLFLQMVATLISLDGEVSLQEWALGRLLSHYLEPAHVDNGRLNFAACNEESSTLLSALAHAGNDNADAAAAAFAAACSYAQLPVIGMQALDVPLLDIAISCLQRLKPLQKPQLLKAMVVCVQHDGKLSHQERHLIRVVAALLDCPLPPLE